MPDGTNRDLTDEHWRELNRGNVCEVTDAKGFNENGKCYLKKKDVPVVNSLNALDLLKELERTYYQVNIQKSE